MPFDPNKFLSQEERERLDREEVYFSRKKNKTLAMTNQELAEHADYCLRNSQFCWDNRGLGANTYDQAMVNIIIPELIKRLKCSESP